MAATPSAWDAKNLWRRESPYSPPLPPSGHVVMPNPGSRMRTCPCLPSPVAAFALEAELEVGVGDGAESALWSY